MMDIDQNYEIEISRENDVHIGFQTYQYNISAKFNGEILFLKKVEEYRSGYLLKNDYYYGNSKDNMMTLKNSKLIKLINREVKKYEDILEIQNEEHMKKLKSERKETMKAINDQAEKLLEKYDWTK